MNIFEKKKVLKFFFCSNLRFLSEGSVMLHPKWKEQSYTSECYLIFKISQEIDIPFWNFLGSLKFEWLKHTSLIRSWQLIKVQK